MYNWGFQSMVTELTSSDNYFCLSWRFIIPCSNKTRKSFKEGHKPANDLGYCHLSPTCNHMQIPPYTRNKDRNWFWFPSSLLPAGPFPPAPVLKYCLTQQIMRKTYQQKTKAEGIDVQVYFTEKNSKNQVIVCILYSAQPGKLCYNREAPLLALKLIWVII